MWYFKYGIFEGVMDPHQGFSLDPLVGGDTRITTLPPTDLQLTSPHSLLQIFNCILYPYEVCKGLRLYLLIHDIFFRIFNEARVASVINLNVC